jgi:5-methylcytosine-specific restriction endonuclease McrBC GTP-binding regulatory subunit McrB
VAEALDELFMDEEEVHEIMLLWRTKKNVILQGPPGVGKSFAAQRLAFALMGAKDRSRLGFVQFHQSYSYEDFVEGFRPTEKGFELRPGKFVEFCRRAEADPNKPHVFIIDEINRGNLSKILGEQMLLIETDKRDPQWSMPLASGKVPLHVPPNVFLMGLMNTADRSLAVVDYALRRRFAFVDLEPKLESAKFHADLESRGLDAELIEAVVARIASLNKEIITDTTNLGPGFAIGHSFFCAPPADGEEDSGWYDRIIRTEILPLLREYWFDNPDKVKSWEGQLLAPL